MADDNESSSDVPSAQETTEQKTDKKCETSNEVELIDLSNDDDDIKDSVKESNQDLENGESKDGFDEENDDNIKEYEDEDEISMENVNGNVNNDSQEAQQPNDDEDDEDEIMISDDDQDGSEPLILEESNQSNNSNAICSKTNQESSKQQMNESKPNKIKKQHANSNAVNEEILIDDDDDDDDDEVQDLSTNNKSEQKTTLKDLVPKLSEEKLGFPDFFKDVIKIGECVVVNKRSCSDIDIDQDYSILDCPSQVVPLIIKKSNKFPPKLKEDKENQESKLPPSAPNQNSKNMLTISDFYSSSIGKFLVGIGLSRVKQWYHKDAINKVRKQMRKEGEAEDLVEELKKQQEYLSSCRMANSAYIFPTEKCENCDFRTEFKLVMKHHMLFPHLTNRKEYKCNYCQFSARDSRVILDHVNVMHEKNCMIELPPQLYECPICPYETGVKSKAATHIAKCLKLFVPDKLMTMRDDYFPTITPKPITQEDIKIYEATLQALRFAAYNPHTKAPQLMGLPPGIQQQMYIVQQQQQQQQQQPSLPRITSNKNKKPNFETPVAVPNKSRHQHQQQQQQVTNNQLLNMMGIKGVTTPQLYQMLSNANVPPSMLSSGAGFSGLTNNAISLINKQQQHVMSKFSHHHQQLQQQHQQQQQQQFMQRNIPNNLSNNKPNLMNKPTPNPAGRIDGNPKGSFVMCEICDGYIKDLDQLRTHMHWIHKVRIHPKMLASRPPLNCQKCQWRFFTDQGLERHLLGAHGLVTSNMQDMVNQNQDGGRCTICGRVFTSKLVMHMNQNHKIGLKPAHLSYKCTVCSATFNLYRLFENHVYMVHSGSVKRNNPNDESNQQPQRKKMALDVAANGN